VSVLPYDQTIARIRLLVLPGFLYFHFACPPSPRIIRPGTDFPLPVFLGLPLLPKKNNLSRGSPMIVACDDRGHPMRTRLSAVFCSDIIAPIFVSFQPPRWHQTLVSKAYGTPPHTAISYFVVSCSANRRSAVMVTTGATQTSFRVETDRSMRPSLTPYRLGNWERFDVRSTVMYATVARRFVGNKHVTIDSGEGNGCAPCFYYSCGWCGASSSSTTLNSIEKRTYCSYTRFDNRSTGVCLPTRIRDRWSKRVPQSHPISASSAMLHHSVMRPVMLKASAWLREVVLD